MAPQFEHQGTIEDIPLERARFWMRLRLSEVTDIVHGDISQGLKYAPVLTLALHGDQTSLDFEQEALDTYRFIIGKPEAQLAEALTYVMNEGKQLRTGSAIDRVRSRFKAA